MQHQVPAYERHRTAFPCSALLGLANVLAQGAGAGLTRHLLTVTGRSETCSKRLRPLRVCGSYSEGIYGEAGAGCDE